MHYSSLLLLDWNKISFVCNFPYKINFEVATLTCTCFFFFRVERKAAQDITIKGIHIKKDMLVSIPVYQMHYDEERWENPKVFRPER